MLLLLVLVAVTGAVAGSVTTIGEGESDPRRHQDVPPDHLEVAAADEEPRTVTWRHERRAGIAHRTWIRKLWQKRASSAWRRAQNPPHEAAWQCIHRYEGAWNDTGAPYYGGLQMDISFQQAYGAELLARKGTADHWSPVEQMWVAERAYRSGRGFYPWPNTARYCGLI